MRYPEAAYRAVGVLTPEEAAADGWASPSYPDFAVSRHVKEYDKRWQSLHGLKARRETTRAGCVRKHRKPTCPWYRPFSLKDIRCVQACPFPVKAKPITAKTETKPETAPMACLFPEEELCLL